MSELAVLGGTPVRKRRWPAWPQADDAAIQAAVDVLRSERWTVSGPSLGPPSLEQRFGEAFARFVGVKHCVPADHGSGSLLIALEALDVGYGDEVIVPALTWVATATAVLNVNAMPVFVDVDPATACMSPSAFAAAVTPRTRAVIPVHLHCTMADMDEIRRIASARGIAIIEDCAQAHGARWGESGAGSLGTLGAFSMQQSKVFTAGEGGAVTTDDDALYDRLQQLRADSRRYPREPRVGSFLDWIGEVQGTNHCMSELQAAVLLSLLDGLESNTAHRAGNARYLDENLARLGLEPIAHHPQLTRQCVYEYAIRCPPELTRGADRDRVCDALRHELGFPVYRPDPPLHRNRLYCPWTKRRHHLDDDYRARLAVDRLSFPEAERLHRELILFLHPPLLGSRHDMDDILTAFDKVLASASELSS